MNCFFTPFSATVSKIASLCILVCLSACHQKPAIDPRFDDSLYEKVEANTYGFYKNKKTDSLYLKTFMFENPENPQSKKIYFYRSVPAIDLASFKVLDHGGYYATDKNHVYIWETNSDGEKIYPLQGADARTFESFGYRWGMDKEHVYKESQWLKGLQPNQMKWICLDDSSSSIRYIDVLADSDQVFMGNKELKLIPGMNPSEFDCVYDLMGNSFIGYKGHLYVADKDSIKLYQ